MAAQTLSKEEDAADRRPLREGHGGKKSGGKWWDEDKGVSHVCGNKIEDNFLWLNTHSVVS